MLVLTDIKPQPIIRERILLLIHSAVRFYCLEKKSASIQKN